MLNNNDKKLKILNLRIELLTKMKKLLEGYKVLKDEKLLDFAKELGKDSERLKKELDKLK